MNFFTPACCSNRLFPVACAWLLLQAGALAPGSILANSKYGPGTMQVRAGLELSIESGIAIAADASGNRIHVYQQDVLKGWIEQTTLQIQQQAGSNSRLSHATVRVNQILVSSATQDAVQFFENLPDAGWVAQPPVQLPDQSGAALRTMPVALSGEWAAIGRPQQATSAGPNAGIVTLLQKQATGEWLVHSSIEPADTVSNGFFGDALALHGSTLAVTAAGHESAYVFELSSNGEWQQRTTIAYLPLPRNGITGTPVDLHQNTLVLGQAMTIDDTSGMTGVVSVHQKHADGSWPLVSRLTPAGGGEQVRHFGYSLALDKNRAVIASRTVSLHGSADNAAETLHTFERIDQKYWEQTGSFGVSLPWTLAGSVAIHDRQVIAQTWSDSGAQISWYTVPIDDADSDNIQDREDNCPAVYNPAQLDTDRDLLGNACDTDDDNDGELDTVDAFRLDATEKHDNDADGQGNNKDMDDDNDGAADVADQFPLDANEQVDSDGDGIGDNADPDTNEEPAAAAATSTGAAFSLLCLLLLVLLPMLLIRRCRRQVQFYMLFEGRIN